MANQQTIAEQLQLLSTHRRTLAILLGQVAAAGGTAYSMPAQLGGIQEARRQIQRIKHTLRNWGIASPDEPDDFERSSCPPGRGNATFGAPPAVQNRDGTVVIGSGNTTTVTQNSYGDVHIYDPADLPFNYIESLNLLIQLFSEANDAAVAAMHSLESRNGQLQHLAARSQELPKQVLKANFEALVIAVQKDLLNFSIGLKRANGRSHSAIAYVERSISQMFDISPEVARAHRYDIQNFRHQLIAHEQILQKAIEAIKALDLQLQMLASVNPRILGLNQAVYEASKEVSDFATWINRQMRLTWRIKGLIDGLLQA